MTANDATGQGVLDIIRERVASGERSDGARVALVLEGGGMRGAISAEMAAELDARGVTGAVDVVVGTSAGAVNATAVAGRVISEVAATYSDVFASPEFVSPARMLRGQPAVDAKKIVAEMERRTAFAEKALGSAGPELVVVATDVDAAEVCALDSFSGPEDLFRSIQASATLPVLGGKPVEHRGSRLLDGGVAEAIPIDAARRAGATHALVVVTRPRGSLPSHGPMERGISRYLDRLNPGLGDVYRGRPSRYESVRAHIEQGSYQGVTTALLEPGREDRVPSRMSRDPEILRGVREDARARAAELVESWGLVPSAE